MRRENAQALRKARMFGGRCLCLQLIPRLFLAMLACIALSCSPAQKNPGPTAPPIATDDTTRHLPEDTLAIVISIGILDTLNQPSISFHPGDNFIIRYRIENRTGLPQLFYYTGTAWEAEIRRGGRTIASEEWGLSYPQAPSCDTFPAHTTGTISWLAPKGYGSTSNPNLPLSEGVFSAKLVLHACFPNAKVVGVDSLLFTILP